MVTLLTYIRSFPSVNPNVGLQVVGFIKLLATVFTRIHSSCEKKNNRAVNTCRSIEITEFQSVRFQAWRYKIITMKILSLHKFLEYHPNHFQVSKHHNLHFKKTGSCNLFMQMAYCNYMFERLFQRS